MTNPATKFKRQKKALLIISFVLFALSLTQQAYCTSETCANSLVVFIIGWAGVVFGGAGLTWLANPLMVLSWYLTLKDSKHSFKISLVATLICLSFLFFAEVLSDEEGHYRQITSYEPGYWLWLSSSAVMLAGNMIRKFVPKVPETAPSAL